MDKDAVVAILKTIEDPELKRDIIALGMVRDVLLDQNAVTIRLESSTQQESVKTSITSQIQEKLGGDMAVRVEFLKARGQGSPLDQSKPANPAERVIAVASGKGGVGKSTVAVNLALALAQKGHKVGLMDGDIYGPNIPLMLGISHETRPKVDAEQKMIPVTAHGIGVISMGVLVPPDQAMVWRGPMLHSAVTQFFHKVSWGELDYLLVDLPPGTGDVQLSLVQNVSLTGAVIVTTPQEVALMDVRKGIAMFQKTNVPILGIIENMTGEVFGQGGGAKAAEHYKVPLLAEIPLESAVRHGGDNGKPIVVGDPQSLAAKAFLQATENLMNAFQKCGSS